MKNISILVASIAVIFSQGIHAQAPYALQKLNYEYKALEPYIDAQTMEIHHSKHHQGYVDKLNAALKEDKDSKKLSSMTLDELLMHAGKLPDAVRNNAGGVYNHNLFFEILSAKQNFKPSQALDDAINASFKDMNDLKKQMNDAASKRFGSGWAWLVVTPQGKLVVTSTPNQDNPVMDVSDVRGIPIIGIDVWEHAYYLKYQNKRGDYLQSIWTVLDWGIISKKYDEALKSKLIKEIDKATNIGKPFKK